MDTMPQGYKDSKVGIIPEEWDTVTISSQFDFLKTYSNSRSDLGIDGEIEYLHYGDIHTKYKYHLDFDKNELPKLFVTYIKGDPVLVKNGDLFIADASEDYDDIGKSVEAKNINSKKVVSGLHTFLIRDKANNFANGYKGLILYNKNVAKEIKRIATGISVLGISKTNLGKLLIPKPPKEEQEKIAEILTTWDNAIENQESLIIEKKQLKKGLMQKLLSGEKRFDEFDDEWEEVKLGIIFKERSQRYKDLDSKEIEQYSELLSVGINSGVTKRSENEAKDNSSDDKGNYKVLKKNDIAYNTMRMWQGASGVSPYNGIVSPAYTIVTLKEDYNIYFFGYFFKLHRVVFDFYRYSQGLTSDTWNIKFPHFLEVIVKITTSKSEQDEIVNVLQSADKEVDLLKQELEELKQQKKGLMQNLLSGKVRVKV